MSQFTETSQTSQAVPVKIPIKYLFFGTVEQIQNLVNTFRTHNQTLDIDTLSQGQTALMSQTMYNKVAEVKLLLELGADPTFQDKEGYTAFNNAIEFEFDEDLPIFHMLIEARNKLVKATKVDLTNVKIQEQSQIDLLEKLIQDTQNQIQQEQNVVLKYLYTAKLKSFQEKKKLLEENRVDVAQGTTSTGAAQGAGAGQAGGRKQRHLKKKKSTRKLRKIGKKQTRVHH